MRLSERIWKEFESMNAVAIMPGSRESLEWTKCPAITQKFLHKLH